MKTQSFRERLVAQFKQPTGSLGRVAGWIMTGRASNRERSRWTVSQLDLEPGDHVLEIGYGPGLGVEDAARRREPSRPSSSF